MTGVPDELAAALAAAPDAAARFEALPPSHRREYVRWVAEAKKPATRVSRAEKTVARLRGEA
ncbi:YdeI/OmpD-associated family protein [Amycolatopsis sp. NPDC005961]|uniref:YdeI/OmpD-associated family protein n=1 Tax=Amycolatopsis sp. NPDC005961 TaxID=3156720 RepID=UPI0033D9CC19